MSCSFSLAAVCLTLFFVKEVSSYSVILKNGKRFEGAIVEQTEDILRLRDDNGVFFSFRKNTIDFQSTAVANVHPQELISSTVIKQEVIPMQAPKAQGPKMKARVYTKVDVDRLKEKYGDVDAAQPIEDREPEGIPTKPNVLNHMDYGWEDLQLLEGAAIISDDGVFLGTVTRNRFPEDSISNKFGEYGNRFSGKSIFNEFGTYGSRFETLSAFNDFSSTPPKIYRGDESLGYLTTNKMLHPRIDSKLLKAWIRSPLETEATVPFSGDSSFSFSSKKTDTKECLDMIDDLIEMRKKAQTSCNGALERGLAAVEALHIYPKDYKPTECELVDQLDNQIHNARNRCSGLE